MRWAVGLLALTAGLSGCFGEEVGVEAHEGVAGTIWDRLADHYETPTVARIRDPAARTADAATVGDPRFAQFDAAMTAFMQAESVAAGQLAVMHDGRLLYAAGYGHTKEDGGGRTTVDTMFRLASVTKPMTHAVLALQVEQGLYNWTDPVFCLSPDPAPNCRIPLDPHPDHPVVDPRIADITVQQLIAHEAGWGRPLDYLYRAEGTEKIQRALATTRPPTRLDGTQYLMGIELPHEPGTAEYCNVCYMVASLVAEAATGAHIGALFEAYLFRPLGVSGDIELGKAFPQDRNPREPFYETDYERPSAYDPDKMVPGADGGFNIELIAAGGGLIATAAAVAAVYEAYPDYVPLDGFYRVQSVDPYEEAYEIRGHSGLLDGTLAGSRWADDPNGPAGTFQYVFLFNNGAPSSSCEDVEVPAIGIGVGLDGCTVRALDGSLLNLVIAKSNEQALPLL